MSCHMYTSTTTTTTTTTTSSYRSPIISIVDITDVEIFCYDDAG